ncbi:bolA-like protein 3 [Lycorma delicatula]|uniref:bolA-like protein 3 n=1 Tax=Lycorma delicatula TaxID=130591 RepID=UPI003F515AF7
MLQNIIKNSRIIQLRQMCFLAQQTGSKSTFLDSSRSLSLVSSNSLSTSVELFTEGEKRIKGLLQKTFPKAKDIKVQDVSGGCGSMYTVDVRTEEFRGLPIIKQHRLVHEALKHEIKDMHGIQINTAAP